ncbi:hypothetical protein SASPL_110998 [Salvia splendens]|uniref:Uncharacterized protein n=1 Tax=Salvia splendens TaxID=180675 RepID=A0A8X9A4Q7_SALSN|nr:hypothetical protein SASPL_110998 [Salvia splendens]
MIQAAAMRRSSFFSLSSQLQQCRGIRVKVINSNLDQALILMQRKMQSSGIERMIKQEQLTHVKNSEKRVLAKKNLERKIRAQDLARKLKTILVQKVRNPVLSYLFTGNMWLESVELLVTVPSSGNLIQRVYKISLKGVMWKPFTSATYR